MTQQSIRYALIRSSRKTIGLEITPEGKLIVRAPARASMETIERVIDEKLEWILRCQQKAEERQRDRREQLSGLEPIGQKEINELGDRMAREFPPRVRAFARQIGVTYGRITIRVQRTRWGSCSAKGNLNFNCLLMMAPEAVQDYVIVHELCHRKEMNHSPRFWQLVESVIPDYREQKQWLATEGKKLLLRTFDLADQ